MADMNIIKRYEKKLQRQSVSTIAFLVILIVTKFSGDFLKQYPVITEKFIFPALILLILGFIIFSLYNWRCPSCGNSLGRDFNPKFCKSCGVLLRLDE